MRKEKERQHDFLSSSSTCDTFGGRSLSPDHNRDENRSNNKMDGKRKKFRRSVENSTQTNEQWPGVVSTTCHTYDHRYFDDNYYIAFRKATRSWPKRQPTDAIGASDSVTETETEREMSATERRVENNNELSAAERRVENNNELSAAERRVENNNELSAAERPVKNKAESKLSMDNYRKCTTEEMV